MAIIESKGNGYSLFNGVKLPNLPEYDKEKYPYVLIYFDGTNTVLLVSKGGFALEDMGEEKKFIIYGGGEAAPAYTIANSKWSNTFSVGNGKNTYFDYLIWSNFDLEGVNEDYDNVVVLAASDPISLDGMNVIEWDGDTEGLAQFSSAAFYVSGTTDIDVGKSIVFVQKAVIDGSLAADTKALTGGNGYYRYGAFVHYVETASEERPVEGIALRSAISAYVSLFAYYPIPTKTTITFNNKTYTIDSEALSTATTALKSHISNVMNGSGATIKLGGQSYNIDATKLADARDRFVTHLGSISGSGAKVTVGGVEYSLDSAKVQSVIADMGAALDGLTDKNKIIYGDIDGDGKVTDADGQMAMQAGVGTIELTSTQRIAADVNGDGYCDSSDALLIWKYADGTIDKFPVEQ
jgi:hypothetical protein